MWPKALSQLVELAPHITRLAPLADRFFKDKAATDDATRQTLESHRNALDAQRAAVTDLSDRIHADIGTLTSAQATQSATVQRQLTDLTQQLAGITRPFVDVEKQLATTRADVLAAKQAAESLEARLARIESAQSRAHTLALVAVGLLAFILILVSILFFVRTH